MSITFHASLQRALIQREKKALTRHRRVRNSPVDPQVVVDKKSFLNFASNDYLGLANDPRVIQAFKNAAEHYGVGSGAAQIVSGYTRAHQALEEELADFLGYPRVLLFSTGYTANIGVLAALSPHLEVILQDKLCHASLVDGGIFSKVSLKRYKHASVKDFTQKLEKYKNQRCLVASDGVFSVQGNIAPLPQLSEKTRETSQLLLIDDAHGIGVLGQQGRGTLEYFNKNTSAVDILIGTFGKAFGTFGAFVAADAVIVETLMQYARSYIYTTALPPAIVEATRKSLSLIQIESWRRDILNRLITYFQNGLKNLGIVSPVSMTPIQAIQLNSAHAALEVGNQLAQKGILVAVMRPPTTPPQQSCLRVTLTALHKIEHLDRLLDALHKIKQKMHDSF
jgi:8-amino-7-oxononanoate synthase